MYYFKNRLSYNANIIDYFKSIIDDFNLKLFKR